MKTNSPSIDPKTFNTYLSSLLKGDKKTCGEIVRTLLSEEVPISVLYEDLFRVSLYKVGWLWENNQISVAIEHLATSITENMMTFVYPIIFSADKIGKKAIITCAAQEYHQIGARMVADVFELCGWDGYFLGANTPENDLFEMIKDKKPDVLGISVSIYFNIRAFLELVERIRVHFPNQHILIGGQAFQHGGREIVNKLPNSTYIESLDQLRSRINEA